MRFTMQQATEQWRAGNSRGEGYAPYRDEAGDDTVAEAIACAQRLDGAELVLERRASDEIAVLRYPDGELVGIGDAHGAWAVPLEAVS